MSDQRCGLRDGHREEHRRRHLLFRRQAGEVPRRAQPAWRTDGRCPCGSTDSPSGHITSRLASRSSWQAGPRHGRCGSASATVIRPRFRRGSRAEPIRGLRGRVELEPHARQAVAAVAAPAIGHALEDPPPMPRLASGCGPGPGSRTSMCSAPRRSTSARSSMRSCAPSAPCSMLLVTSSETMSLTSPVRAGSSGSASTARRARTMDAACGGSRWVASWSGTCGMQRRRAPDLAVKYAFGA